MAFYLDHNASTPPLPEVVEAMLPWLRDGHANPHSEHVPGRRAAAAVERAKAFIGALVGVDGDDIVLTSGATESNNIVLQGYLRHHSERGALVHTTAEHKCVMEASAALAREGCEVRTVPVDALGRVDPRAVRAAVDASSSGRVLVSLIHANNEIGTVQSLAEVSQALQGSAAVFHSDAAQSVGRLPVDALGLGLDFLTFSSHKLGGPAGIGALFVAPDLRTTLRPLMHGGGQQDGLRPGTIPVFLAVGFGVACELAVRDRESTRAHAEEAAQAFLAELGAQSCSFEVLGDPRARLPGLRSIRFLGVDAREILDRIGPSVSASTGSACAAGELKPSHVLRAIGLREREAIEVVRFGFGRGMPTDDARAAARIVANACRISLRHSSLPPPY